MKAEPSWKRYFCRIKTKYIFLILFLVGIIPFVCYLFYLKELNSAVVGKVIVRSVETPNNIVNVKSSKRRETKYSKLMRDKSGRTVSLSGARNEDISKYLPNDRNTFVCISSKEEIDFIKINDNYCDCPLDGSDEPGTNACNNGFFYCDTTSLKFKGSKIPSYKVHDGYCDCCDGSDEWIDDLAFYVPKGSKGFPYHQIECINKC